MQQEVPLEERAARAAEEEKQNKAAAWEREWRHLYDEIVPRAVEQVKSVLGVATSPDDWGMPKEAPHDTNMAFATTEIGGVKIVVRRDFRTDYDKLRWSEASGESYGSSFFFDGYVILPAEQKLEPLTLAAFGEAQRQAQAIREQQEKAEKGQAGPQGPDLRSMRNMWAFLAAWEEGDLEAAGAIWNCEDQLRLMSQAVGEIAVWIREAGHVPAEYARRAISHITADEVQKETR